MGWDPGDVFRFVDVLGVVANGLLGGAVARSRRFDLFGFATLAIISALGGGMLRDVLLDAGQPVALTDPAYLSGALVAAALAYVLHLDGPVSRRLLVVADLLALGCWSATGTLKATGTGLGVVPSVLLGVITAVGGGMVRDVVVGQTPRVFGGNTLYATLAIGGSAVAFGAAGLGQPDLGMGASIGLCLLLGLAARRLGWMLPEPLDVTLRFPRVTVRRFGRRRRSRS
ncbi:trimeric intracellular cation channel family protein [Propioniciclava soli]|uniref:TRIC cation channel family protein n=1 Tax=Propioniciclava soli TaxID=2775081 RepID=A0ABZ3C7Y0_9ACTN